MNTIVHNIVMESDKPAQGPGLRLANRHVIPRNAQCVGIEWMHSLAWAGVTLGLAALSFGAGRMTLSARIMPEIVATLPGDESLFSRELDARLRERFPIGTAQDKLIGYLIGADFVPDWPQHGANASMFIFNGWLCTRMARVLWRADDAGSLTNVSGSYESHCL
jgi:hypothetical protein